MPISYLDLLGKVRDGALAREEIAAYFLPAASAGPRFAPAFVLNEVAVDVSGMESVARASATELAYQASLGVRAQGLEALGAPTPDGTIVAEGDSWFNLPDISNLVPPTLVDILARQHPINNIAHWGDTLAQIVASGEYVSYLGTGRVACFLFSAGGNDALGGGRLAAYIRQRQSGDTDPGNASLYVRSDYYAMAARVEATYRALLTNVRRISPQTIVIIHGYAYSLPRRNGQWLGEPLRFRGFDPVHQRELARAIVRVLVDDFNIRLERLADAFENVRYVDLRKAVADEEWWDELHPGAVAAEKLAALIGAKITSNPPAPAAGLPEMAAVRPTTPRKRRRRSG